MAVSFLLDEDVSPTHVSRIAARGFFAQHVAHLGLAGTKDWAVVPYAVERSLVIITKNVDDFLALASSTPLHPGMIVLRDGRLRVPDEWAWIAPVLDHLKATGLDPINIVIDVRGPGLFAMLDLPER